MSLSRFQSTEPKGRKAWPWVFSFWIAELSILPSYHDLSVGLFCLPRKIRSNAVNSFGQLRLGGCTVMPSFLCCISFWSSYHIGCISSECKPATSMPQPLDALALRDMLSRCQGRISFAMFFISLGLETTPQNQICMISERLFMCLLR